MRVIQQHAAQASSASYRSHHKPRRNAVKAEALVKFIEQKVMLAREHDQQMKDSTDKEFGEYASLVQVFNEGNNQVHSSQLRKEFSEFLVASGKGVRCAFSPWILLC
jgi:hypothetical protein